MSNFNLTFKKVSCRLSLVELLSLLFTMGSLRVRPCAPTSTCKFIASLSN